MIDDVSLRDHLESRMDALKLYIDTLSNERKEAIAAAMVASEKAINAAMVASEKAIVKAEAAQEKRNEGMNEFRQAMVDQQANFAAKGETDLRLSSIEKRLDLAAGTQTGKGASWGVMLQVFAAGAAIAAMLAFFMRTQ